MHKKVRSQKKKRKDFWNNINFLILHVCLGLNTPRNQPDPDWGKGGCGGKGGRKGLEQEEVKTKNKTKKKFFKTENTSFVFTFRS